MAKDMNLILILQTGNRFVLCHLYKLHVKMNVVFWHFWSTHDLLKPGLQRKILLLHYPSTVWIFFPSTKYILITNKQNAIDSWRQVSLTSIHPALTLHYQTETTANTFVLCLPQVLIILGGPYWNTLYLAEVKDCLHRTNWKKKKIYYPKSVRQ